MSMQKIHLIRSDPEGTLAIIEAMKAKLKKLEDSEAKKQEEIEALKEKHSLEYKESMEILQRNFDDANDLILKNQKERLEQARKETRQQCADIYEIEQDRQEGYYNDTVSDAIRNSGQDKATSDEVVVSQCKVTTTDGLGLWIGKQDKGEGE